MQFSRLLSFHSSDSVPSENKKDKRSVEETMNAIRAKKKQKIGDTEAIDSVPGSSSADS